ncbi:hypothetical protein ACFS2C_13770 [Prauserella oleivorans]|uniref:Uncharacterized protein n=1 Tax=Prauserella oleivorans TaxID=1478153 RepID=A0ABW5WBJ9_9PSEU
MTDEDRATYVDSVRSVLVPGGRYFMLCFSDQQPGDQGPRRVRHDEITTSFAQGWRIDSIEPTTLDSPTDPDGSRHGSPPSLGPEAVRLTGKSRRENAC